MKVNKRRRGLIRQREREGKCGKRNLIFFYFFLNFFLISMKIGPQVFVRAEGKVDLRDKSYAWTPKFWSFVKLYEVGNFPTCVISNLKVI